MKNKILPILVTIMVVSFGYLGFKMFYRSPAVKFIVSRPFSVSQISQISKFRSCFGTDYSGYNSDLQLEQDRSMKHYLTPKDEFLNSNSSISIFSPFEGLITNIEDDKNSDGYVISISPKSAQEYEFIFFNVIAKEGIIKNQEVSSGQLIGYAQLKEDDHFSISVEKTVEDKTILESPFDHMSSAVISEYSNSGIKIEELTISKKDRDSIKCTLGDNANLEEWVILQ